MNSQKIQGASPFEFLNPQSESTKKKDGNPQEAFLTLLTAQLKNQDPFKPLESGEFLTQIASFTTASGIQGLQQSFDGFSQSMSSNQALQATGLVGKEALIRGNTLSLTENGAVSTLIELPQSTPKLQVQILADNGQVIKSVNLGNHAAGEVSFSWDGLDNTGQRLPAGKYKIAVNAEFDGKNTALNVLNYNRIDSVSFGNPSQGLMLNLDNAGTVKLADVKAVR